MPDEIMAMLCAVPIIALPFVFFGFLRYMRYKETVALADRGLVAPINGQSNGQSMLRWGIVTTALGLALTCGLYPIGWAINEGFLFGFGPWMLVGLLPTALGLALLLIAWLTRKGQDAESGWPGPGGRGIGLAPAAGAPGADDLTSDAPEADMPPTDVPAGSAAADREPSAEDRTAF
ncbi:hypothetical protein DCC79_12235 [bacterium]|nr:MAG: hypothetical protein DCC79_12235 [bacterium]